MDRRDFIKNASAAACSLGVAPWLAGATKAKRKPNFVVIFIDDMGYGDIEPFGSKRNKTPNLNRMAEEGAKFTDFYVASTQCSPSRAALMTGCYAKRVGMHGKVCFPKKAKALQPSEYTMAEMFKDAGYATGCFGKWHLGHREGYLPNDQGFDVYQGIPYSNDMWAPYDPKNKKWKIRGWHVPLPWLVDGEPVAVVKNKTDQGWLTQATTRAALKFIREEGAKKRPFFAYLPYAAVHHPRVGHPDFLDGKNHLEAQIEELDWAVGEVFKTLEDLGIEKNTIVLFMSDNGGSGGTSMGPLRGGKGSQYEGGIRTPFLAWWPETIPAGAVCREIGITSDLLPTFAKLCGGKLSDNKIDGRDISDMFLHPETAKSPHEHVMHTGHLGRHAVCREGKWKMVDNKLYDLEKDIGEKNNVADQHPEKLRELKEQFHTWNETIEREQRPHAKMPDPGPLVSEAEANAMPALSAWLK